MRGFTVQVPPLELSIGALMAPHHRCSLLFLSLNLPVLVWPGRESVVSHLEGRGSNLGAIGIIWRGLRKRGSRRRISVNSLGSMRMAMNRRPRHHRHIHHTQLPPHRRPHPQILPPTPVAILPPSLYRIFAKSSRRTHRFNSANETVAEGQLMAMSTSTPRTIEVEARLGLL